AVRTLRRRRGAAVAGDLGGVPLADPAVGGRAVVKSPVRMRMDVDEAGTDDLARDIDGDARRHDIEARSSSFGGERDHRDPVADDGEVAEKRLPTEAVDDRAAAQD